MKNAPSRFIRYVWLVPLAWAVGSLLSFRHPGDEYGFWASSSIAGVWWVFFTNVGDIHQWHIPWLTALLGMLVLAPFAYLMDRLKVDRWLWLASLTVGTIIVLQMSLSPYESYARALAKHRTLQAYLYASFNVGIYFSIIFSLLVTLALRAFLRLARRRQQTAESTNKA